MPTRMDTGNNPKMPKRTTSTTQILEAPPLKPKLKRTRSLPAAVQAMCLPLSETPVKNLSTRNHSPTRKGVEKPSQRRHSSKKSIPDPRGKVVCFPEVEESSRKGKRTIESDVDNGGSPLIFSDATNVHSASSSSTAGHQEAKVQPLEAELCAELCIRSDLHGSKSTCDHGDMLSSGQTLSKDSQGVEIHRVPSQLPELVPDDPQGVEPLLPELMDDILGRLESMREVMQLRKELGKALRNAIHRPAFLRNRPDSEGEFSPSYFMTDDAGDLLWHGFDTKLREWTRLPSLNFARDILPSPDPDLFTEYLVAGDGGLLCVNVGKAPGREKLVICNPLTQQVKVLPPLNHARHPVLMHLKVDHSSGHYKVFVAGSAAIGTEELSLKTEEYDSRKGVWECPDGSDLPCPPFGLNEYQNGVYFRDFERELLMCVAIVDERGRGVLMYDITKKEWAQGPTKLHIPLVRREPNDVSHLVTTQIVECGGSVFVFSEQECGWDMYSVIHKLSPDASRDFAWDEVMVRKRSGERGLLEHPEFTCVAVSDHELCIFNTLKHTIEMIDLNNPTKVTPLRSAPTSKGNRSHSLNPIGFVFKPSFRDVVCPRGRNVEFRCDLNRKEHCSECEGRGSESFVRTDSHMIVGPEVINPPVCVEARFKLVSAPTQECDMSSDLVESGGAPDNQGRLSESCGNLADEEREQDRNGFGKLVEEIRNFVGQLPERN